MLAPGPDWVAVDIESGALLRAPAPARVDGVLTEQAFQTLEGAGDEATAGDDRPVRIGSPLSVVELVLADGHEPPDVARPEAAYLAGRPRATLPPPRRRAVRHLLERLVTKAPSRPLLGTLGPSVAYSDLDGMRPSVVVVTPDQRPRFGNGPTGPWCQFALGGRRHAVSYVGDPMSGEWLAKYLVVGFGSPARGQVPKVVLGALPNP